MLVLGDSFVKPAKQSPDAKTARHLIRRQWNQAENGGFWRAPAAVARPPGHAPRAPRGTVCDTLCDATVIVAG
jgi:hypothetical protein